MATKQTLVVGELTAVDNTQAAFNSVQRNANKTAKTSKQLNQQFRFLRGGAGQLGHQIQDVAVQFQMGTNAMIIMGQQGGQIASLFGPKGAIVGAFISVAAAAGLSLAPRLMGVTKNFDDLESQIKQTVDELNIFTEAQRKALIASEKIKKLDLAEEQIKLKKEIKSLNKEIDAQADTLETLNEYLPTAGRNTESVEGRIKTLTAAIDKNKLLLDQYNGELDTNALRIEISNEKIDSLINSTDEYSRSLSDAAGMTEKLAKAEAERFDQLIEQEGRALDASARERERAKDKLEALLASLMTEIEAIEFAEAKKLEVLQNALNLGIVQEEQAAEIRKRIAESTAQAIRKSMLMSMQSVVTTTSLQVNQLAGFFDEASAIGKAFFVVSQTLAAADAVIKGFQSAMAIRVAYANMAAMAGPGAPAVLAAGEAHAAMAIGLGVATAAAIAGQTLASFEGGGMIPNGPRAGGVDGRGGRMAIVHPNEKITDMRHGGDSQPVNISFNIQANDARGFDEMLVKRRALIVNMVNQAINNRGRRSLT